MNKNNYKTMESTVNRNSLFDLRRGQSSARPVYGSIATTGVRPHFIAKQEVIISPDAEAIQLQPREHVAVNGVLYDALDKRQSPDGETGRRTGLKIPGP